MPTHSSEIARLTDHESPLGAWYGNPLSKKEAHTLGKIAREREHSHRRRGSACITCQLQQLIAMHWQGQRVDQYYQQLSAHYHQRHSRRALALLELIMGQIRMTDRRDEGKRHLIRGFELAQTLFAPADYFTVLNRHQLLQQLPPLEGPAPLPLSALLTTAAVIGQLSAPARPAYKVDRSDIYG